MELKEIERLAFLKYRLSGKKSMNTFIFSQAKKYKLSDIQIETLINNLEKKIENAQKENAKKELESVKIKEVKGSTYILA